MQQEIEECMNTITATLTKLRAHIRKLGVAGKDCPIHGRRPTEQAMVKGIIEEATPDLPTEPECTCECCMKRYYKAVADKAYEKEWKRQKASDLPLKARVAIALGKKVREHDKIWEMLIPVDFSEYSYCKWIPIPDYDKHRDLAMGALEERCRKEKWCPNSMQFIDGKWEVAIGYRQMTKIAMRITSNSLSEAICEAIAKHAEGV